ncbi:transposase, Mutator family protein [Burkholderia thailandensis E444]|nr:transposase, Mutator family protein [Burkholderia thailandensis E444]
MWIKQTEGAKFWLKVFNELKNRGLHDILIAVVDGLRGFPEAIEAVYPAAQIQTCIVHLIRNSLNLASWKDRKPLAAAIKPIYQAATAEAVAAALESLSECLCVRHKLMAKEPLYATQTQGRSDD